MSVFAFVVKEAFDLPCLPQDYIAICLYDKLYKQIDGCGMGNPLSPVLANIFMAKLEADVVRPFNPPFYDRYVDDCFSEKKKDEPDSLFERLNCYHPNIVFTVELEENPDHFLDTAFSYTNKSIAASSRNRGNYLHIGNLRSLPNGKGITSLAPSIEPNAHLPILTRT